MMKKKTVLNGDYEERLINLKKFSSFLHCLLKISNDLYLSVLARGSDHFKNFLPVEKTSRFRDNLSRAETSLVKDTL